MCLLRKSSKKEKSFCLHRQSDKYQNADGALSIFVMITTCDSINDISTRTMEHFVELLLVKTFQIIFFFHFTQHPSYFFFFLNQRCITEVILQHFQPLFLQNNSENCSSLNFFRQMFSMKIGCGLKTKFINKINFKKLNLNLKKELSTSPLITYLQRLIQTCSTLLYFQMQGLQL